MARQTVTHENTADYLCATWGDVLLFVWRGRPTLEGVEASQRGFDALAADCPGGLFFLTVVEAKAKHPDGVVRAALSGLLARGVGRTRRFALVYEGSGFNAAIVRSVMTEVSQLASVSYPRTVLGSLADAARFFEPELGPAARQMPEAIQAIRQAAHAG